MTLSTVYFDPAFQNQKLLFILFISAILEIASIIL